MWEEIERRYADPGYAPDWRSRDDPERPPWDTVTKPQKEAFSAFVRKQLDRLEAEVRAERVKQLETEITPQMVGAFADGLSQGRERLLERMSMLQALHPGADFNELIKIERRMAEQASTGEKRRGPTLADPAERARLPVALAARDVRRMRDVIFPRFWGMMKRDMRPKAEEIAAERRGVSETAVKSWIRNNPH